VPIPVRASRTQPRAAPSFDLETLVDPENGVISRELFVNPEIFEAELERVFTRAWLFVGHEGPVPDPDDFFAARCRFPVYRNRLDDEQDFFVGKRNDTLRRVEDCWKLARRELFLDQSVMLPKNLSVFL
jgi:3-phenylpropionate/cinnamic acid dioxygenase small subunit